MVLVLYLLRQNPVQEAAAELFGIGQSTVSRRWTTLLPVVEKGLADHVPDQAGASAGRIVVVDGTLIPAWDWTGEGAALFSGKHRDTGFSLRLPSPSPENCSRSRVRSPAVGTMSSPGQSAFPEIFAGRETVGDLGRVGTSLLTGRRKPPDRERCEADKVFNQSIGGLRAAVERALAHLKDWKVLATRYRGPLDRFPNIIKTVTALAFHKKGW